MKGKRFFHRSAGALGCHTRIRAGFHRDVKRVMKHPEIIRHTRNETADCEDAYQGVFPENVAKHDAIFS